MPNSLRRLKLPQTLSDALLFLKASKLQDEDVFIKQPHMGPQYFCWSFDVYVAIVEVLWAGMTRLLKQD